MEIAVGAAVLLLLAATLTVVDIGTNNNYLEPWNRKLWPSHARKTALYFAIGVLGSLFGLGATGFALKALTTVSETTTLSAGVVTGLVGELVSAKWVWHRELRRDHT